MSKDPEIKKMKCSCAFIVKIFFVEESKDDVILCIQIDKDSVKKVKNLLRFINWRKK